MGLKIEAECGIREIIKARCGIKIGRRDRNTLPFEGGIRDRTGIDGIDKIYRPQRHKRVSICVINRLNKCSTVSWD